jgi:hypothetical protein
MAIGDLLEKSFLINIDNNKSYINNNNKRINGIPDYYVGFSYIYYNSDLVNYTKNFLHIHNSGTLTTLENLKLSNNEIDHCNANGLEIFLTEQLYYLCAKEMPILDFANFKYTKDIDNAINVYYQDCKYKIKSPELDSCKIFIKSNNLKNVTICVSNTDPNNLLDHYNLNIIRKDPFLQSVFNKLNHISKSCTASNNIQQKFWCGNWRYEPHRHVIAAYMSNFDTKLSWWFNGGIQAIEQFYWFKFDSWKNIYPTYYNKLINGIDNLNNHKYIIDLYNEKVDLAYTLEDLSLRPDHKGEHLNFNDQIGTKLYQQTFCSIVTLSSFATPFPTYDEKPLNAILNHVPFILVGTPRSLDLMKQDGFKTFSNYWDESYDNETDHQKRFIKIFEVIEYIDSLSIKEIRKMYADMKDILQHNYNMLSKKAIKL